MTFNDFNNLILLAQEGGGAGQQGSSGMSFMLFIVLMFVMMYFLTIRPQRVKQKQLAAQIAALKTGDKIVTTGGIHGLVTNLKERTVVVKIADNVKIEIEKPSVATVISKDQDASGTAKADDKAEEKK